MSKHESVILLGSNLNDRLAYLNKALEKMKALGKLLRQSKVYETESWGRLNQPLFLNQVIILKTILRPLDLLDELLKIEKSLDRQRFQKWEVRTIDLDILYYDKTILKTEKLTLPHPYILDRRFTLLPLCEILPHFKHPIAKKNHLELILTCTDKLNVKPYT